MQDWHTLSPLLNATKITLLIAICALFVGLILSFIITILESWRFKPVSWFVSICVITIRALPEMLIVIAIYNGLPLMLIFINDTLFNGGMDLTIPLYFTELSLHLEVTDYNVNPILCGIIALSILYAVYASQTLRGALKAIPAGQKQAAQVLGLSKSRTFIRIIIPQMWRYALPGLGNQWLVLLKDTALVSLIAVNDIMLQTRSIIANTREPFTWYLIAATVYLIISLLSQRVLQYFETRSLYFEQPQTVSEK